MPNGNDKPIIDFNELVYGPQMTDEMLRTGKGMQEYAQGQSKPPEPMSTTEQDLISRGVQPSVARASASGNIGVGAGPALEGWGMAMPYGGAGRTLLGKMAANGLLGGSLYAAEKGIRGQVPDLKGTAVATGTSAVAGPIMEHFGGALANRVLGRWPLIRKVLSRGGEEGAAASGAARTGSAGDPAQWSDENLWQGYMKNRGQPMGDTLAKEIQRRGLAKTPTGGIRP